MPCMLLVSINLSFPPTLMFSLVNFKDTIRFCLTSFWQESVRGGSVCYIYCVTPGGAECPNDLLSVTPRDHSVAGPHVSLSTPCTKFPATFPLAKPSIDYHCLNQPRHLKSTNKAFHIQVTFSLIVLIPFQWYKVLLNLVKLLKTCFLKMYLYLAVFHLSCIFFNSLYKAPFLNH